MKVIEYYGRLRMLVDIDDEWTDDLNRIRLLAHRTTDITVLTILVMCTLAWLFTRKRSLREIYSVTSRTVLWSCGAAAAIFAFNVAVSNNLFHRYYYREGDKCRHETDTIRPADSAEQ